MCFINKNGELVQGWRCNAGTILRIVWNLRDYDLGNIEVLSEQLIGCDTFFMMQLIEGLRAHAEQQAKTTGIYSQDVGSAYLTTLLDKLF